MVEPYCSAIATVAVGRTPKHEAQGICGVRSTSGILRPNTEMGKQKKPKKGTQPKHLREALDRKYAGESYISAYEAETAEQLDPDMKVKFDAFIAHFMRSMNATRATRECGYFKESNADTQGCKLKQVPYIKKRIAELTASMNARYSIGAERFKEEIATCSQVNMGDFVVVDEKTGMAYTDFRLMDRRQMAAISEITVESYAEGRGTEDTPAPIIKRTKLKLVSKERFVELGAKMNKILVERSELTGADGKPLDVNSTPTVFNIVFRDPPKEKE